MKLTVPIYKQGDPRWGGQHLGTSAYTLASDGCTISVMSMLACYYGHQTDPGKFNTDTTRVGGFVQGSLYVWGSITKLYPDIKFIESRDYPFDPAPVDQLKERMDQGHPTPVWLDFNPRQAGNQMHWVLVTGYTDNDLIINDPWYGDEVFMKARYGDPVRQILGHRLYTGHVPNQGSSDDTIPVNKSDFENLVRKSSQYDEFVKAGFSTPAEVTRRLSEATNQINQYKDKAERFDHLHDDLTALFAKYKG